MLKMHITYKKVYVKLAHIKNYMYLCNVIIKKMFNPLISETMSKELEERIKRKKKMIADFLELSEKLKMKPKAREKRIDAMLEDLKKLMNERD